MIKFEYMGNMFMKKIFIIVFLLILSVTSVEAKTLKGKVVGEISTYYPAEFIKIEVMNNVTLKNVELRKGYIVVGTMTDVKSPEKNDKEASFIFTIKKYRDLDGTYFDVKEDLSTIYRHKSLFDSSFFKETDLSFMPNMPVATDSSMGGTSANSYKNVHLKPMSVVNSLVPEEYRCDDVEMGFGTGLQSDKDDILLLDGDRIKFVFPD